MLKFVELLKNNPFNRKGAVALRLTAAALLVAGFLGLRKPAAPGLPLLQRRIATVDFRNTPLEQALSRLGDAVGTRIVIDRKAMLAEHVDFNAPINLCLHNVQLQTALERLSFDGSRRCTLEPEGDELRMTSLEALPSAVRLYDVTDLIDQWMAIPPLDNLAQGRWHPPDPLVRKELMESLSRLITDTVQPRTWAANRGTEYIGSIGTRLIVSSVPAVHRDIVDLLRQLRAANAKIARKEL